MRRSRRAGLIVAAAAAGLTGFLSSSRGATTALFDNGGGDQLWSNPANWNPDGAVDTKDPKFDNATGATAAGTVTNIVDGDKTISSLWYSQSTFGTPGANSFHTTQINSGATLTINGNSGPGTTALLVGANLDAGSTATTYTSITGAGTLTVNNGNADINIRQFSPGTASGNRNATLDLSGLSVFNATVRNLNVGAVNSAADSSANRSSGTLILANTNNITCTNFAVGYNASGASMNPAGRVFLGTINNINADSFALGARATPNCFGGFNVGLTNPVFTLRSSTGGRANLTIGCEPAGDRAITSVAGTLDLIGGTYSGLTFGHGSIDAKVALLAMGRASTTTGDKSADGTFLYDQGTVDANDVVLGDDNAATSGSSHAIATLSVKGAGQLIVNSSFILGKRTGTIIVPQGILNVDGATAKVRANTAITDGGVASSPGTATSTINVKNGATLQARGLGSGTSIIDNLTLDNSTLVVDISGGVPTGSNAWGYVGALNVNNTDGITGDTVGLQYSGTLSTGAFHAISYASVGGALGDLHMAKQPARITAHLDTVSSPGFVDIVIDTADQPKWNGTVNGNWDIQDQPSPGGGTTNWKLVNGGGGTKYQEDLVTYSTTDTTLFDDSATGTKNVNITTTVSPTGVTVDTASAYTFSGSGKISGATGITKKGIGSLTISNTGGNNFTGAIDIQNGSVIAGAADVLPHGGTVSLPAGATLNIGAFSQTIDILNVTGGTHTATSGNLNAGKITVTAGSVTAGSGTIATPILDISGGSVTAGSGSISATNLTLSSGASISPGAGSITAGTVNLNGGTLGAGAVAVTTAVNATSGQIDASLSGPVVITKSGTGTLLITSSNTYSGLTDIEGGAVRVSATGALGTAAGITFIGGAGASTDSRLELTNNVTIADPILFHGRAAANLNPHIVNVSGNNTISGNVTIETGGTNYFIRSDGGKLTMSGNLINPITPVGAGRDLRLGGIADGEWSGSIQNGATSDPTVVHKQDSGTWTLSGANTYTGATKVEAGKLIFAATNNANALNISDSASAEVAHNGNHVLLVSSLALNSTGKLDLKNNKLIDHTDAVGTFAGAYDGLSGKVTSGMGSFGGGGAPNWDGNGIITSETDAKSPSITTTLGVASAADVKQITAGQTATWAGQTVASTDALVMYTYAGDANLSGNIDADDYFQIDSNYNKSGSVFGFFNGDFNYDGQINGDDYFLIDANHANPLGTFSSAPLPGGVSAVPEPCMALAAIGLGLVGRRRRSVR